MTGRSRYRQVVDLLAWMILNYDVRDSPKGRPAIAEYETEMRTYGYAAVRTSLTTLRLGLISNPVVVADMTAWFRLCAAAPAVGRLGFRDNWAKDARRRPWE